MQLITDLILVFKRFIFPPKSLYGDFGLFWNSIRLSKSSRTYAIKIQMQFLFTIFMTMLVLIGLSFVSIVKIKLSPG